MSSTSKKPAHFSTSIFGPRSLMWKHTPTAQVHVSMTSPRTRKGVVETTCTGGGEHVSFINTIHVIHLYTRKRSEHISKYGRFQDDVKIRCFSGVTAICNESCAVTVKCFQAGIAVAERLTVSVRGRWKMREIVSARFSLEWFVRCENWWWNFCLLVLWFVRRSNYEFVD